MQIVIVNLFGGNRLFTWPINDDMQFEQLALSLFLTSDKSLTKNYDISRNK